MGGERAGGRGRGGEGGGGGGGGEMPMLTPAPRVLSF